MTYLVMDNAGHRIVTAENLRREIDNGIGRMRIFRLCDLKDPKELCLRWEEWRNGKFSNNYFTCFEDAVDGLENECAFWGFGTRNNHRMWGEWED